MQETRLVEAEKRRERAEERREIRKKKGGREKINICTNRQTMQREEGRKKEAGRKEEERESQTARMKGSGERVMPTEEETDGSETKSICVSRVA